jgi:hypothetical protein
MDRNGRLRQDTVSNLSRREDREQRQAAARREDRSAAVRAVRRGNRGI